MSLPQVEVLVELRPGILACLDFKAFVDLICLIIFFIINNILWSIFDCLTLSVLTVLH